MELSEAAMTCVIISQSTFLSPIRLVEGEFLRFVELWARLVFFESGEIRIFCLGGSSRPAAPAAALCSAGISVGRAKQKRLQSGV